ASGPRRGTPAAQAQDRQIRALLPAEQQVEDLALLGGADAVGAVERAGPPEGRGEAESVDGPASDPEVGTDACEVGRRARSRPPLKM
ncbi:hypothetical protein, partial [Streptomyces sp. NPDC006324]|uniref:hypothetical protein n=1 Tax=Streptomyces sp. NPDC006324 TaxID=3156751 RepID=UPI0033B555A5